MNVIALDVGGSSVKHSVIDLENPSEVTVQKTPVDSQGTSHDIIETFAAIVESHWVTYPDARQVAFGFPGPFDYAKGVCLMRGLEKYEALYGQNVGQLLCEHLSNPGLQIRYRNDAEAAILGEVVFGVGQDFSRIIGVTIGTGMGSAFIADGVRVVQGQGIPKSGWLYAEPFGDKRADDVFSTRGLVARLHQAGHTVDEVAEINQQDAVVQTVLAEFGRDLGRFLSAYTKLFAADCVIVLGGISAVFDMFEEPLRDQLSGTHVRRGRLGVSAALLGCAQLFADISMT